MTAPSNWTSFRHLEVFSTYNEPWHNHVTRNSLSDMSVLDKLILTTGHYFLFLFCSELQIYEPLNHFFDYFLWVFAVHHNFLSGVWLECTFPWNSIVYCWRHNRIPGKMHCSQTLAFFIDSKSLEQSSHLVTWLDLAFFLFTFLARSQKNQGFARFWEKQDFFIPIKTFFVDDP